MKKNSLIYLTSLENLEMIIMREIVLLFEFDNNLLAINKKQYSKFASD